jgi:hypothetical protein
MYCTFYTILGVIAVSKSVVELLFSGDTEYKHPLRARWWSRKRLWLWLC